MALDRGLGRDGLQELLLAGSRGTEHLLSSLLPGNGLAEEALGLLAEESNVDEDVDELGEALVSHGTTDDGLGLGDVVALLVGGRVAVGVSNEGEA